MENTWSKTKQRATGAGVFRTGELCDAVEQAPAAVTSSVVKGQWINTIRLGHVVVMRGENQTDDRITMRTGDPENERGLNAAETEDLKTVEVDDDKIEREREVV